MGHVYLHPMRQDAAVRCSTALTGASPHFKRWGIQPRGLTCQSPWWEVAGDSWPWGAALHLPLTHVKDEEAEGANSYGSNLFPVPRETIPLVLILIGGSRDGEEEKKDKQAMVKSSHPEQVPTTLFPTLSMYKEVDGGAGNHLCLSYPPSCALHRR